VSDLTYKGVPIAWDNPDQKYVLMTIPGVGVLQVTDVSYREACLMNGWDPDLPPVVVVFRDEVK
jgi:hypothetical protein